MPLVNNAARGDALLSGFNIQSLQSPWLTLKFTCSVITPIYGGGERSGQLSEKGPRSPSIKGQLRAWWRLLNIDRFGHDHEAMFSEEALLFGSARDDENSGKSKITVQASGWSAAAKETKENLAGKNSHLGFRYSLGVLSGVNPLLQTSGKFELAIGLNNGLDINQQRSVMQALSWWSAFGGLGGRTRRGFGKLDVVQHESEVAEHLRLVNPFDVLKEAGHSPSDAVDNQFRFYVYGSSGKSKAFENATDALTQALKSFADFRQTPVMGRNEGQEKNRPGRSRWPEPDAIRLLTGVHARKHEPKHLAGKVMPRAAFGMPIIVDFKSNGNGPDADPAKTILNPVKKGAYEPVERMASPLIFSVMPVNSGHKTKWAPVLLVLPMRHITQESLQVAVQYTEGRKKLSAKPVDIWPWGNAAEQVRLADSIYPIKEMRKIDPRIKDPVAAFAQYFLMGGTTK